MDPSSVYLGHDNAIAREVLLDGALLSLVSVTRVTLSLKAGADTIMLDSRTSPELFNWTERPSVVQIQAGHAPDLHDGRWTATLVLYMPAFPAGLVVPSFPLYVHTP